MTQFQPGCLVEVTEDVENARHPTEGRGLWRGDRFKITRTNGDKILYDIPYGVMVLPSTFFRVVETVDSVTPRDELVITHFGKDEWFVFRRDNTILCYGYTPSLAPFKVYRPILWPDYAAANKWVKEGCLADLQEGLGNLDVRFTDVFVVQDKRWP